MLAVLDIIKCIKGALFLPIWHLQKLIKRDPYLWVIGSWSGQNYSDNTKFVYEYVLSNRENIKVVWITENIQVYDDLRGKGMPVCLSDSFEGKKMCMKAGFVFLSSGVGDVCMKYINGAKQVWLWHGMPLKKIEADIPKKISTFKRFKTEIRRIFVPYELNRTYDFLLSSSDFFSPMIASAFKSDISKVHVLGSPRNDIFFVSGKKSLYVQDIDMKFNSPIKLLYMPTFRDANRSLNFFENFDFSIDVFKNVLKKNNMVFLYKGHFYEENSDLNKNLFSYDRFSVVNSNVNVDTYQLLNEVDVLVTDYSSVYFDFILTKKPVILTPFDIEDYVKYSRPLYFDYYDHMEGVKAKSWVELFSILETKSYYPVSDDTVSKFNKYRNAGSSARVVDFIIRNEI
ncbi:MAG: CDP-glycerol glycerophosphotransferase family protein [Paludibacteraceae bacterium]